MYYKKYDLIFQRDKNKLIFFIFNLKKKNNKQVASFDIFFILTTVILQIKYLCILRYYALRLYIIYTYILKKLY